MFQKHCPQCGQPSSSPTDRGRWLCPHCGTSLTGVKARPAGHAEDEPKKAVRADVLRVSGKSRPKSVAGAIAGTLREHGKAEIQAVGAGAVNQAVKAIAIARGFVAPQGIDLISIPGFVDIMIDGEERTAMKFVVEVRRRG